MAAWPLQRLLRAEPDHADGSSGFVPELAGRTHRIAYWRSPMVLLVLPLQWRGGALAVLWCCRWHLRRDLRAAFPLMTEPARLTRVTVLLDVGQGTSVRSSSPVRYGTLVYDTGGGTIPAGTNIAGHRALCLFAPAAGAGELDTLVISHPDS